MLKIKEFECDPMQPESIALQRVGTGGRGENIGIRACRDRFALLRG